MVRLRLGKRFNSHWKTLFTIHYGEIKTSKSTDSGQARILFTIHYGEIKTSNAESSCSILRNLQSTMVRLRPLCPAVVNPVSSYLQSTMVRLRLPKFFQVLSFALRFTIHYGEIKTVGSCSSKAVTIEFTIHYGEIKTITIYWFVAVTTHLQSTMVRLRL